MLPSRMQKGQETAGGQTAGGQTAAAAAVKRVGCVQERGVGSSRLNEVKVEVELVPVWPGCPRSPTAFTEDKQRAARCEAGGWSVMQTGSTGPDNCDMVRGQSRGVVAAAAPE